MTRIALITGGTSGIGLACSKALMATGIKVMAVDINTEGSKVATEIGAGFVQADLSQREGCKQAVDATVETYGGLDILINNAGFQHIEPIVDFPEDTWDTMISLMLTAPFLMTKYAWPHLISSGQGRIVNVGSAHSLIASPYKSAYVSAKHGILGLMRVTALEGGEHGLTCNTICPAYVRTPLVEKQIADQARTRGITPEEVEEKVFLEKVAIKRLLEPEDVANYVAFLCSEGAWGITGSVQSIDMGWTAS